MHILLGSRSPRRLQLLQQLLPAERIEVLPPRSVQELGFGDVNTWPDLQDRILHIARQKCVDVLQQLESRPAGGVPHVEISAVLTADTVIVATPDAGRLAVLGQPPREKTWDKTVRGWFQDYFAGQTHYALTGLCVERPGGPRCERVVKSEVTFRQNVQRWLDWYISTGESIGKAGGYALQGAGSVFIERVQGSISNVIGLPLEALLDVFEELQFDVHDTNPKH